MTELDTTYRRLSLDVDCVYSLAMKSNYKHVNANQYSYSNNTTPNSEILFSSNICI